MNNFSQMYYVALNTFNHLKQGKVLLNTFFLSLALMLLCFVATRFTFGVPHRVALDFGLGLLTLSSIVISLSLGVGLIADEIEGRTLYVVLSRSVKREVFLIGKTIGLSLILLVNVFILGTATVITYKYLGGEVNRLMLWAIFFIMCEAQLLLMVTIFLSLITNKALTIILALSLWSFGHIVYTALSTNMVLSLPKLKMTLKAASYIFPGFYKLNLKDYVLYDQIVPGDYLFSGISYVVLYSLGLMVFSCLIFKNKNLD